MNIENAHLKTLAQIGFAACFRGLPREAIAVLEGISAVRPNNEKVTTALAIAYMNAGRMDDAIKLFRDALETDPDNATAKSFLGLTLKLVGRNHESARLLDEVKASSNASKENKTFATMVLDSNPAELRGNG